MLRIVRLYEAPLGGMRSFPMNPGVVENKTSIKISIIFSTPNNLNSPDEARWSHQFFCATHRIPDGITYGRNEIISNKMVLIIPGHSPHIP